MGDARQDAQRGPESDEAERRREFIRSRPEDSPEQGAAAGPGSPETVEPMQGERLVQAERDGARR